MSEKRLPFDFGWKLAKDGMAYACPACLARDSMYVDVSNERDIGFSCKKGCTREQILTALGEDPDAEYFLGMAAPDGVEQQPAPEAMPVEVAQQWLAMASAVNFPDYAWQIKRANNGTFPLSHEGAPVDEIATAFGYKITADRRNFYQLPTVSSAADLLGKTLTPPRFAVEGLLPAGLCIFSAPSKTGKSWLALDLCNAVAGGLPFMGRQVNQGDALYLALEDSEYGLQKRMRKIGCHGSSSLHYAFTVPIVGAGMTEFLSAWCASVPQPRLIVIDVLQRAKPSGKANKTAYEQDYDLYAPLNAFALEKGIAILAITHNRKSNGLNGDDYESISGSVGQMGAAQTAWLITGKRGQTEDKTFKATGRDIREVEDLIRFNPDTCRWENMGSAEEAAEKNARSSYTRSPIRRTLLELIDVDGSGSWFGTYNDLFEEIAERTGEYPYESPNALSTGIRPMMRLLAQNDGILHKKDNHKSGYHKFFRQAFRGV